MAKRNQQEFWNWDQDEMNGQSAGMLSYMTMEKENNNNNNNKGEDSDISFLHAQQQQLVYHYDAVSFITLPKADSTAKTMTFSALGYYFLIIWL